MSRGCNVPAHGKINFARLRREQLASAPIAHHVTVNSSPAYNTAVVQLGPFAIAAVDDYVKMAGRLGTKIGVPNVTGAFEHGL